MAIKYQYTYTEYKDFPEATEISKSREGCVYPLFMLFSLALIASIIGLVLGEWVAIFGLLISIAAFYYLFRIYPEITKRKIAKAIKRIPSPKPYCFLTDELKRCEGMNCSVSIAL